MKIKFLYLNLVLCFLLLPMLAHSERIVFTPQWTAQAQFAGYYIAQERGFYDEMGLDVDIVHPTVARSATEMLKSGESDFVTMDLITALKTYSEGEDLKNILQTSQRSGLVVVSHEPLNGSFEGLRGKRVARWKAGFSLLASSEFQQKGIDVEWVDFLSGINVFLSGATDATLAMSYNELLTLRETGAVFDTTKVVRFAKVGFNIPEEGLYTTGTMVEQSPDVVNRFRVATAKGWEWARDNREEALDVVMRWVQEQKVPTNRVHQRNMLNEVIRLQYNDKNKHSTELTMFYFEKAKRVLSQSGVDMDGISYDSFVKR